MSNKDFPKIIQRNFSGALFYMTSETSGMLLEENPDCRGYSVGDLIDFGRIIGGPLYSTDVQTNPEGYPKVLEASGVEGKLVFFTEECVGTVIAKGAHSDDEVGDYFDDWYMPVFVEPYSHLESTEEYPIEEPNEVPQDTPQALTGGSSSYYDQPFDTFVTTMDQMEYLAPQWKEHSVNLKDIFKALVRWGSKGGTTTSYDAEKLVYYSMRTLKQIVGVDQMRKYVIKQLDDKQFEGTSNG